jgi:5'-3' exonuclease
MILNAKSKFEPIEEIVLCLDNGSWRKDFFPYYKARRIIKKDKSDIDWEKFHKFASDTIQELSKSFPIKVVNASKAEGDDCIASIVIKNRNKNFVIVSRDKDFLQLTKYNNCFIYNPIDDKVITKHSQCPHNFLIEHIIAGDSGDDIPNIFSPDKQFVTDNAKRQKSITKNILTEVMDNGIESFITANSLQDNYKRNRTLIELSEDTIPKEIIDDVLSQYDSQTVTNEWVKVDKYLHKYQMESLYDSVSNFLVVRKGE